MYIFHSFFIFSICLQSIRTVNCTFFENDPDLIIDGSIELSNPVPMPEQTRNVAEPILNFWKEQDEKFQIETSDEVVLLVGNTGAGMSAATLFLTGDELVADEYLDSIKIKDENGRIGEDSLESETLIPELIIDPETGTKYFDCPGFLDTRTLKYPIANAFLLNKLFNSVNSFKLVFVVNYPSVEPTSSSYYLMQMIEQALAVVKDFRKIADGIAMIVTKVDNTFVGRNNEVVLLDDAEVIRIIAKRLESLKNSLSRRNLPVGIPQHAIEFLKILLEKKNDKYQRIGLIRRVEEVGRLSDMEIYRNEKFHLKEIIHENIKFVSKPDIEFGYSISSEISLRISKLMEKVVETDLYNDVSNFCNEIEQFYRQQEQQISDVNVLFRILGKGYQKLSKVETEDAPFFIKSLIDLTDDLGINITSETFDNVAKHFEQINLLETVREQVLPTSTESLYKRLNETIAQIIDSGIWYKYLINIQEYLSKGIKQTRDLIIAAKELKENCLIDESETKNLSEIGLDKFLRIMGDINLPDDDLRLNSVQLKALISVLNHYYFSKYNLSFLI